jgi:hypothetical protein
LLLVAALSIEPTLSAVAAGVAEPTLPERAAAKPRALLTLHTTVCRFDDQNLA